MRKIIYSLIFLLSTLVLFAQKPTTKLFQSEEVLPINISFSSEKVKNSINDTLFFDIKMKFQTKNKTWNIINVGIRARGNFRRGTCYFPPIKMKIKKKDAKETLFQGNKKLKLVLPCIVEKSNNDNVLKEFIAYKLFEIISPYHFKTRQVSIIFNDIKNNGTKKFYLRGFFIEDDKKVAKRFEGKVVKKYTHPLAMEANSTIRNAFFQYMIGNSDFSMGYRHNGKLVSIDDEIVPVPYDFDMAGLINPSYIKDYPAVGDVRKRKYLGYKREESLMYSIRDEYIENKPKFFELISKFKTEFDDVEEHKKIVAYINSFYEIIENDDSFEKEVINKMKAN